MPTRYNRQDFICEHNLATLSNIIPTLRSSPSMAAGKAAAIPLAFGFSSRPHFAMYIIISHTVRDLPAQTDKKQLKSRWLASLTTAQAPATIFAHKPKPTLRKYNSVCNTTHKLGMIYYGAPEGNSSYPNAPSILSFFNHHQTVPSHQSSRNIQILSTSRIP